MRSLVATLICITIGGILPAQARPQYSAIFGQSCFLCHVNPTGNGMRELYGSQFFAPQYLPVKSLSYDAINKIKPKLSENVTIGADLRTIFLATNTQSDSTSTGLSAPLSHNTGTISQMEGNLYLELRPSEQFMIYYSQGVADASGRFEAYGLANLKGWKGWIKAGQFQENYGYRFADHTAYTRTGLWGGIDSNQGLYDGSAFSSPTPPHYGVGAEAGTRLGNADFSVSHTGAQSNIPMDRDTQKRWIARVFAQRKLPFAESFVISAGGSWLHASHKAVDPELGFPSARQTIQAWGGFGGISFTGIPNRMGTSDGASNFGWLATSLLFEYDRKAWTTPAAWTGFGAPGFDITSAYSTTQLDVMVYQGVWLQAAYDWMDNAETSSIGGEAERTTVGLSVYALPWVEISPRYRLYSSAGAPGSGIGQSRNKQQLEGQIHVFF
ncbi:hypothetical protein IT157_00570 [bacterium]|nr:hypothetical protein [bacterium]